MFGANPKRPPIAGHDGLQLDVVEIFPTIQGEGPLAGMPAVFLRLGGCNLACDFCDTEFETYENLDMAEVVQRIGEASHSPQQGEIRLIVITGGEPLRHNLLPLCEALLAQHYTVQIETNGTLYQPLPDAVQIVCSPKNTNGVYAPLRPDLLAQLCALKFIVSADHAGYQQIPLWCLQPGMPPVFVQPMDAYDPEKNEKNRQHAVRVAMEHGVRLSLQLHKLLNIP